MRIIPVDVSAEKIQLLEIGYQGENEVTEVDFNVTPWEAEFGTGSAVMYIKRKGDGEPYYVNIPITVADDVCTAKWLVDSTDTAAKGRGSAQLRYYVNDVLKKTIVYPFKVAKSLMPDSPAAEPYDDWLDNIETYRSDSEAYAVGTRFLVSVDEDDVAYHNNAKYYAEQMGDAIQTDVYAWLDAHPEATTTVEDGEITEAKLNYSLANSITFVAGSMSIAVQTDLEVGRTVLTKGFSSAGDFGGGLYIVLDKPSGFSVNNCTEFDFDPQSSKYLKRVFYEPFVYLESLNFGVASYSTILDVIAANNIHDVRANNLSGSTTVEIKDFDFTFNRLNYTGTGSALLIDGVTANSIKGNEIKASSGTCITVTCTGRNCIRNSIDVRDVQGSYGLSVLPVNGNGIMHNFYKIGDIIATNIGVQTYIPSGTGYYSWQGEDIYSIGNVKAEVGVSLVIDPVNNITEDGTITGLTFLNLAVEYSTTGVYLRCGTDSNPENGDATIKSIYINNMRCREVDRTDKFLDARGYFKDLYVKPTSPIKMSQWDFLTTCIDIRSFVDAPVCNTSMYTMIGFGLCSRNGVLFIKDRMAASMNVTSQVIDFSDLPTDGTLFTPNLFYVADGVTSATIHLAYLYDESRQDLYFSVPNGCTVNVDSTPGYTSSSVQMQNSSGTRHLYKVDFYRDNNNRNYVTAKRVDLGATN